MTKNQTFAIIFALVNLIIIHSQFLFPFLVIEQEIWAIFSWVLILGKVIAEYMILMTLSKESASKISILVIVMNIASYLFSILPALTLDKLISLFYNTDGAHFIGWFILSIISKTIIESWIALSSLPHIDKKNTYLWLAVINTIAATIGALGYVFTYYIKIT